MVASIGADPFPRPSEEITAAYAGISPATIGHLPGQRVMSSALKPAFRRCRMVGVAFTVHAPAPDNSVVYEACGLIGAGDVMVVDRSGDTEHACFGEFRGFSQKQRGVAGWIVDGAATDILEIEEMALPVFARSWSARIGQPLDQPGTIQQPIQCGGVIVNPGDLIIADDNGIVVLSPAEAEALLPHCLEVEAAEMTKRHAYKAKLQL